MIPTDMFYFIVVQDGLGLMYRERAFLLGVSSISKKAYFGPI